MILTGSPTSMEDNLLDEAYEVYVHCTLSDRKVCMSTSPSTSSIQLILRAGATRLLQMLSGNPDGSSDSLSMQGISG
jgi:hypothetical protein